MALTVKQRGQYVATFRFIEVRLMEILSAWVPSTPEMEAKLLFGPHIWDCAQAADALGKRTYELRMPAQHSVAPSMQYLEVLQALAATAGAPQRIAALYDGMLPALSARYRRYLEQTDTLMDAPSVRVIEHILGVRERMLGEANALRASQPVLRATDPAPQQQMAQLEASVAELLAHDGSDGGTRQAA